VLLKAPTNFTGIFESQMQWDEPHKLICCWFNTSKNYLPNM